MNPARFRAAVATVLLLGVTSSAVLVAIGFLGSLAVGWQGSLMGGPPAAAPMTDFGSVFPSVRALRPVGIAQLGLLVLVATPVLRVATSVFAFALEGDRLYMAITVVVLAILSASLFLLR